MIIDIKYAPIFGIIIVRTVTIPNKKGAYSYDKL